MRTIDITLPNQTSEQVALLSEFLSRKYSHWSDAPVFTDGKFARFISDESGNIHRKRISSLEIALQIRATVLKVLIFEWILTWVYRPIIIESWDIPRHNDDDSQNQSWRLWNSIKKVNDAITLIVPIYGFENTTSRFHSDGSGAVQIQWNGKQLIIHDQVEDHWVESLWADAGLRKLWWSGLIKRSVAQNKRFI